MSSERYPLVYADPPWAYRDKANAGKRGAEHHYPVLSAFEIAKILDHFAAVDCTLFLWETAPTREDAIKAAKMCGFQYRTRGFLWVKTAADGRHVKMGMGHWTRTSTEECGIWTRGKDFPRRVRADVRQVVFAPVTRHSEKPAEVRDRIVELMGDVPRIELFARGRFDGWEVWGNEVPDALAERGNEG